MRAYEKMSAQADVARAADLRWFKSAVKRDIDG